MQSKSTGLEWGVKESLRQYVLDMEGEIRVSEGAEQVGDSFVFPVAERPEREADAGPVPEAEGAADAEAAAEPLAFGGRVVFSAHEGELEFTIDSPAIEQTEDGAVLTVESRGKRILLARLPEATEMEVDADADADGAKFAVATPKLAGPGVAVFAGFYAPGSPLAPLRYRIR